jgi:hypothetical protein
MTALELNHSQQHAIVTTPNDSKDVIWFTESIKIISDSANPRYIIPASLLTGHQLPLPSANLLFDVNPSISAITTHEGYK